MSVGTFPTMMIENLEGQIKYLKKRIYNLEAYIQILEDTYLEKPLDKSEKEVRTKVRGTDLVEGEGPMGDYGDV